MALVALVVVVAYTVACSSSGSSVVSPGCLGASGQSCGPYPEGTFCPGTPIVCVQCGATGPQAPLGVYEFAPSGCTCVNGAWDCAPPTSGTGMCSNPFGPDFFSDPACSMPLGDAGPDASVDGAADGSLEGAGDASLDSADGSLDSGVDGSLDASADASSDAQLGLLDGGD